MFLTCCSPRSSKTKSSAHLVPNDTADADPTRLGQRLQTRRDIYAIAEDVVLLSDHVAEIDPDPELDPLFRRGPRVPLGHAALDLKRATNGVDHARELGKEAVAGVLHNPAAVFGDLGVDQFPEMGLEPFVRPLLIHPHQPGIRRHVGGEDCG
jgi:hypothetical protein